jgi:collagenase-like PrtC family protease
VQLLSKRGVPFVTGPMVNVYNTRSLRVLAGKGLKRWTLPIELSGETLAAIQAEAPESIETEVFAFGRMPLTLSARCFTARAHNLPKDDCQFRCINYPDGYLMRTQDDQPLLALNGIQTVSALSSNLLPELPELQRLGVDVLRISPQSQHCDRVVQIFRKALAGEGVDDLAPFTPLGTCNGYWHGDAGMQRR